mgnify:CR=1 FL=1
MEWIAIALGGLIGVGALAVTLRALRPSRRPTFDPFTVGEPWRQFAQRAQRSAAELHSTIGATPDGPLKDRMSDIVSRLDDGLVETWAIARRGHQLDTTVRRLDPVSLRSKLSTLEERLAASPASADDLGAAIESVRGQIETTERLRAESAKTADRLQLTQTRLDELVSRATEVSVGAGDTDAYAHDVDDLVIELEALRLAVEETNRQ